jgi:hypothetical protein
MAIRAATEIDDGLALSLMRFAADLLKYPCPTYLPSICIDPDMVAHGQFSSTFWSSTITLKRWREGNRYDQCVLVHELTHFLQHDSGVPMNGNIFEGVNAIEVEAIMVQCAWLKSKGEDPRNHISQRTIFRLTGDRDFATLNWLTS